MDQIPPEVLLEWGAVFSYGEEKYGRNNWHKGAKWHEFVGSALRHIYRWQAGEDIDPESGQPHLAHALWNIGCLRFYQIKGIGEDDRPRGLEKGRAYVNMLQAREELVIQYAE